MIEIWCCCLTLGLWLSITILEQQQLETRRELFPAEPNSTSKYQVYISKCSSTWEERERAVYGRRFHAAPSVSSCFTHSWFCVLRPKLWVWWYVILDEVVDLRTHLYKTDNQVPFTWPKKFLNGSDGLGVWDMPMVVAYRLIICSTKIKVLNVCICAGLPIQPGTVVP